MNYDITNIKYMYEKLGIGIGISIGIGTSTSTNIGVGISIGMGNRYGQRGVDVNIEPSRTTA